MKNKKRQFITGLLVTFVICVSQAFLCFAETATGSGFETKEDAARAYIQGFINHDVQQMLSACALETYVDHYDLERQIERLRSLPPISTYGYLPANGEFAYQINLETRRSDLTRMIRNQYLSLTGSDIQQLSGNVILDDYDSAADLISSVYGPENAQVTMEGDILPGYLLSSLMLTATGQWGGAMTAYADRAERIDSVAAFLRIDGTLYVMTLGTECFDGKWYVTPFNLLQNIMAMDVFTGGLVPMEVGISDEEVQALMDTIFQDERLNSIFQKVEEALSSLDLEEIFAVSDVQTVRKDSYAQAFEDALNAYLSEEERAYLNAIME